MRVRAHRVVLPDGMRPASVHVVGGRIAAVEPYEAGGDDLGDLVLMPGLVDTHVHVNEPGRTHWEGFSTATRAAVAGGVTTILDMPLNSLPPTVTVAALEEKRAAATGQSFVDVGFWGGAVPGNLAELPSLYAAGVFGFKCFLVDSGVPEFPPLDAARLELALGGVDALFVVHAEDPHELRPAPQSRRYADFLASRPRSAEDRAVTTVLRAAHRTGARVHVLHLSASDCLPRLAEAQRAGLRVTAETCPHYLTLSADEVPDGGTAFKCCPPIREPDNREALWAALGTGVLSCVVSDHSPCPPELKAPDTGDFAAAWGGIASLQLGLPLVWTAAQARGYALTDVVRWMATAPAALAGLTRKGAIAVGHDADLVAFGPDEMSTVDPTRLYHRHPVTPYAGRVVSGVVHQVWLRGEPVDPDGEPRGQLLRREES